MSRHTLPEILRTWAPLLPLLVLLAGSYWLNQQVLPLPPVPDYKGRHDPDYVVEKFSAVTLGVNGSPRYMVSAQKMEHFPDDDTTHLVEPRVTAPYRDKPPVHIRAARGKVSRNGDEIIMQDEVQLLREASALSGEMKINTSYLRVLPDEETADTDKLVTITGDGGVTSAVGMKLDAAARTIKLLSRVRSQYEPGK